MRSHLYFSTLGKIGLVLLLILLAAVPQMDFSNLELTGIRLPLRRGHSIDIVFPAVSLLVVVFVQKLRRKPLNHYAGDLVVASLLLSALAMFVFSVFF